MIRNGVFIPVDDEICKEIDHGIITTEQHFKEMILSPASAVKNFVQGKYNIIGTIQDFLGFLAILKKNFA
jgi:hypothetical protein